MAPTPDIFAALQRYWGYSSFRPLQERIVGSLLEGRDACVVMPTGGGKSLCYQLPAALLPGQTVIVVSPLIALMQDQMAQLTQMGIPAAVLNSTMPQDQQSQILRKAATGEFRLLYLSPERLARADSIEWLKRLPISLFAIDEAHCISEWGHEFRPEYRQLSSLRNHFPDRPIAAFTASATRQVRHDIMAQLQLRHPDKYIASFHRPNLRYIVKECDSRSQNTLMLRALNNYGDNNLIVYAPTIKRVEETVDFLESQGIPAIAYHGQMNSDARRRNQERWMSDEVRILVGTIAFGLGINKAAVRAVIHLSLPKSVEQYYQEAGRAGRDGLPADCILLWQKKDAGLLAYFIGQLTDNAEKERAWRRYHAVRNFVESEDCRHLQICFHFGETAKWKSCNACDVCGASPSWLAQPIAAAKPKRRAAAAGAGPSLVGAGLAGPELRRAPHRVNPGTMQATQQGGGFLAASQSVPSAPNHDLREYLREWRRTIAKEQGMAAFIVMHDTTLDELARLKPTSLMEIRQVPGFGEKKTERYGPSVLDALKRFREGARATPASVKTSDPAAETMALLERGCSLEEIAQVRDRQLTTVASMVAGMVERGEVDFEPFWIRADHQKKIEEACSKLGMDRLKPLKEALPEEISYDEIRLVLAHLRHATPPGEA